MTLTKGVSYRIVLPNLRNEDGTPCNTATVWVTCMDPHGVAVPNFYRLPMTYVEGSNGNYDVVVSGALSLLLSVSTLYRLICFVINGNTTYRTEVPLSLKN